MDNFETFYTGPEPEKQDSAASDQQTPRFDPSSGFYHATLSGRQESPFENSPYMNYYEQNSQQPYADYVQKKAKKENKAGKSKAFLRAILTIVLIAVSCMATAFIMNRYWEEKAAVQKDAFNNKLAAMQEQIDGLGVTADAAPDQSEALPDGELTPGQVYERNVNSVVMIYSAVSAGTTGQQSGYSTGSGFILSEDGYVVTNYHVVEGGTQISVVTAEGAEYSSELVGFDKTNDIALLKADATGLQAVTLGSSDALKVGDRVAAIGNPLGELTSTLTVGYISAKDRNVTTDGTSISMMQTDAAINSGNSGGPLFNMKGQVVGITTAKYSGTSSSGASIEGVGFAIPMDDVVDMLDDLRQYGYVTGAYLGVTVRDVSTALAKEYNLPLGARIESVVSGLSAARAGIQPMDIIIDLGGHTITSVSDLTRVLRKFDPGQTTTVKVYRGGAELDLSITLDDKPQQQDTAVPETPREEVPLPSEGSFGDWFDYFAPFFDFG